MLRSSCLRHILLQGRQFYIGRAFSSGSQIFDPPSNEPEIPLYAKKDGETLEVKRSRLLYQSRKRGILENDLILSTFANTYLNSMSPEMLNEYDHLINTAPNDWDIYYWATGAREVPREYNTLIMDMLQEHTRNKDKEKRYRQPDLS